MYKHYLCIQSPQELQNHWRLCLFNELKYSSGGERFLVFTKMDRSLAMLQGIMQPVVLTEMFRGTRQKQQVAHELRGLLQTLSMPSKWQQSTSMELAHSVNPSYWEVNYKQAMHDHVMQFYFLKILIYRCSTVGDNRCSKLHHCNSLLE